MKSNFLTRPTLIVLCIFLLVSTNLLGCTNDTFVPTPVSNSNTQVAAENTSYPTPAATLSELIADLSSDDPIVREVSINALDRYGEKASAAVPQLRVNLYYEESSEVRRSASVALGKLGILAKASSPDLVAVIENDTAPGVVVSALNAIGEIGDAGVIPHLALALYCDSNFYENRFYNQESCYQLAILSAEAISKLSGQHFTDAGTGIYTFAEDGIPRIVVDSRKWWDNVGQFEDWSSNQPTSTEQPELSTAVKPHASEIDGRIYAWIDGGYYFSIREPFNGHSLKTSIPNVLDPNQAILLAFAPYSDRIAYLTIANQAELWIADLDLSKVEKVWIDDIGWLGEIQSRDYLQLAWGPRDNSVILTSTASTPRTVLYNTTTKTADRISGACDQIGLPPVFKQPTLVCLDKTSGSRFYLPGDGTQEVFSTGIISPTTVVQNWAFSPDGTRVLFATEQNDLGVSSDDRRQMSLLYTYYPPACCGIELMRDDLQWSQDGTRLLIYGREPKAKNPRWYVLDANLGEPVWAASPEDVVRALANQLSVAFDMALSPDGLWIVTSYFNMEEASRYMAITSLTTGQEIEINEGTVDLLKWVDH